MHWVVLTGLLLASSQAPLGSTLIAVALPQIATGLESDVVHATTLLVSSYLVLTVLLQGPAGRLSDTIGHLRTLRWGMGLFAVGSLAGFASPTLGALAVARCITAVGGALVVPSTMAIIRVTAAPERRGRVFGTFGAVMALSAALGPLIGAEIVGAFGWRFTYLASLPFLAAAALIVWLNPLPDPSPEQDGALRRFMQGVDWQGLALLAAALVLVVAAGKIAGPLRAALLAGGLAASVAFAVSQWRSPRPALDVALLRNPVVAAGTGIMALHNFAMYGLLFQLPAYFEQFHETSPRAVGQGLFAMMIGMVVASPLGGRLADRLGARLAGVLGAGVVLAGTLLMCRLASFASPLDAAPALLMIGMGLGLASSPAQASAMAAVAPAKAGMAAGLSSTMRYLGGIATIAVQAALLSGGEAVTIREHVMLAWIDVAAAALAVGAAALLPRIVHRRS
ncbi:MAG: MFS transporter [Alsobacter sp.]